ncbi:uncharacterized protein LOC143298258 [Babylonia areolata]|uniref:uncharacterized protein LOC143298258 n=1 Tax=Babylonia areolata TaxID=304850 RepID=UPI003FCF6FD1
MTDVVLTQIIQFSVMDCVVSDNCRYTMSLRREASDLVNKFLMTFGSSREMDTDRLCTAIEELCVELQKCLTRCRSLPPVASGTVLEVMVQHNLLFARFLKARCSQSVHHRSHVLPAHAPSLLWSLHRVQQTVGVGVTRDDSGLQCPTGSVQEVGPLLSSLLHTLPSVHNQELRQSVSLLACLWALLTLLEEGASSPLPWLSPLSECHTPDDRGIFQCKKYPHLLDVEVAGDLSV